MKNTALRAAIEKRTRDYRAALEKLEDIVDDDDEARAATWKLREAIVLVGCLRRLLEDQNVAEVHAAFGAPGDFGYETAIGAALYRTYSEGNA